MAALTTPWLGQRATAPEGDDALLGRACSGDRAAWSTLVARYERRVVVALLAEGLRLEEAKDVAQDAWARIWEQHQRGALAELSLPGIVITQARYLAKDALRRGRASPVKDGEAQEPAASVPSAESQLISVQALAKVRAAFTTLSSSQQQVFQLANGQGVPHAAIAARVGLSVQRIRQIVWEVRVVLRAALEES